MLKPTMTILPIRIASSGFYEGFNRVVSLGATLLIGLLIAWIAGFSEQAGAFLNGINEFINAHFGVWYLYAMAFFVIVCVGLALWPAIGRLHLGIDGEKPEFSRFSWVAMVFGAGIGVGLMTYSTAEPIHHFSSNPEVIVGAVEGESVEAIRSTFKWSFFHWGFSAWGCYALTGLALAFFSYSRGLPLTIRSALFAIFGRSLSGSLGHIVDIVAVIAVILGVTVTVGFGVSQFASGVFNATGASWAMSADGSPTLFAMLLALLVVMIASTVSALSGVGRGIKWLSNLNMILSCFTLAFFLIFGATLFSMEVLFVGMWDYLIAFPEMAVTVWNNDGTEVGKALADWQGAWTVFYWAWWIAFAPFVGLFLARISRGRSIREYVLGVMIFPSVMCFMWFSFLGGTAIELELSGVANNAIIDAGLSSKLFAIMNIMLSPNLATAMSVILVVLLFTFLVTSANAAMLVINTIAAAGATYNNIPAANGAQHKFKIHIIIWGVALTAVIGFLLMAGGLPAISTAVAIGALPFSLVMVLMGISLIKALVGDGMRRRNQSLGSAPVE